ncbi:MAG: hypothetical protein IKJ35_07235 [Clostridia bacterium]|nr:hypothetical protein [Clostridia bacterium]
MRKRRTRQFKITLLSVSAASALFLLWIASFGKTLAQTEFRGVTDAVFAVMALAVGSFLAFSFLPYFRGEKRWYSISALLTVVFFAGTAMLFSVPLSGGVLV